MSTTGALSTILYLVRMEINHPRLIFPRNPTVRPMSFDYSVDMNTYDANDASSSTSSSFPLHVVHVEPLLCANIPPFSSHEELQSTQRDQRDL